MKRSIRILLVLITAIVIGSFITSCGGGGGSVYISTLNLLYPAINNIFGVPVNALIRWNSQNIVSVDIYLGETEQTLTKRGTVLGQEYDLSGLGLENGKVYYIRLVARDTKNNVKNSAIYKFTTESLKTNKDAVLESVKNKFDPNTVAYIESSEFNSNTGCGTVTTKNIGEETVRDIWKIMGSELKNNENKVFPMEISNAGNLTGTYQYYDSRVYNINIDTSTLELENQMAQNNDVKDDNSIIYKLIYEGFAGLKLKNAVNETITMNFKLQSQNYKLVFVIK